MLRVGEREREGERERGREREREREGEREREREGEREGGGGSKHVWMSSIEFVADVKLDSRRDCLVNSHPSKKCMFEISNLLNVTVCCLF